MSERDNLKASLRAFDLELERRAADAIEALERELYEAHGALVRAQEINRAWIQDWKTIAAAAGESSDIMLTSLFGRVANMRHERDELRAEVERLRNVITERDRAEAERE